MTLNEVKHVLNLITPLISTAFASSTSAKASIFCCKIGCARCNVTQIMYPLHVYVCPPMSPLVSWLGRISLEHHVSGTPRDVL